VVGGRRTVCTADPPQSCIGCLFVDSLCVSDEAGHFCTIYLWSRYSLPYGVDTDWGVGELSMCWPVRGRTELATSAQRRGSLLRFGSVDSTWSLPRLFQSCYASTVHRGAFIFKRASAGAWTGCGHLKGNGREWVASLVMCASCCRYRAPWCRYWGLGMGSAY